MLGQKEDSAQAFAPVATGFQYFLLLQRYQGQGTGLAQQESPREL